MFWKGEEVHVKGEREGGREGKREGEREGRREGGEEGGREVESEGREGEEGGKLKVTHHKSLIGSVRWSPTMNNAAAKPKQTPYDRTEGHWGQSKCLHGSLSVITKLTAGD